MFRNYLINEVLGLPRLVKRIIVVLNDSILCILSSLIAFYLRLGSWSFVFDSFDVFILFSLISIGISTPIFYLMGLYREIFRYSGWPAMLTLLQAIAIYSAITSIAFTFIGIDKVPRTIGILQPLVLLLIIGSSRAFVAKLLSGDYKKQLALITLPRVIIFGAGKAGRQIADALVHGNQMKLAAFVDDDQNLQGQVIYGRKIYWSVDLIQIIKDLKINIILLAIPFDSRVRRNQILLEVRDQRVKVKTLPSVQDLISGKIGVNDLNELDVDDLLGRELVKPIGNLLNKNTNNKVILITGAGGSIGGELCLQILINKPKTIILMEQSEFALYKIHQKISNQLDEMQEDSINIIPILGSVLDKQRIRSIFEKFKPQIVYHAAAYKHVPLVEANVIEGVKNNVVGAANIGFISCEFNVEHLILISTDKAVRPTNVMGASKRLAEIVFQALASTSVRPKISMVRFGNVLNSSGSVVPKFRQQIASGGPITITDFRMTRFFMTIPEAAQLVIQAGSMAEGGEVFLLDMGEPVKILDLAKKMIELSGLSCKSHENPKGDIDIVETGHRPGEKLYEELIISGSPEPTLHPKIFKSNEKFIPFTELTSKLGELNLALQRDDVIAIKKILAELVDGYFPIYSN